MNKFLIFSVIVFFNFCFAQNENYNIEIEYDFITNSGDKNEMKSSLFLSKDKSFFEYQSIQKNIINKEKTDVEGNTSVYISDTNKYYVSMNISDSLLLENQMSLENKIFDIKEKMPKIEWVLVNETKIINNYFCSKATTKFRGRYYTAWYTTDIQTIFGPWKFNGLPGLILEISDRKKEVLINVKIIKTVNNRLTLPNIKIEKRLDRLTFIELNNKILDDQMKTLYSQFDRDVKVTIESKYSNFLELNE